MFRSTEVANLLGVSTEVLRDRDRRFGYAQGDKSTGRRTGGYEPKELLLLSIAEIFMADGHEGFEARRMAYWVQGEIASHLGLNDSGLISILHPRSSGIYRTSDTVNLSRGMKYAAFAKNANPCIGSDVSVVSDLFYEDCNQVLLVDLERLAFKVPAKIVQAIRHSSSE